MLRRRKKDQRAGRRPRPAAPGQGHAPEAPPSRRRARAEAAVPPELRIPAGGIEREKPPRDGGVVLLTGFDPFEGERLNPSWEICRQLDGRVIEGLSVQACKLPCEFRRSIEVAAEAIDRHHPAVVISIGQAGGRAHMSLERVAINVDDARIADNAGARPIDEPIAANGPPAYFATIPVKAMAAAMRAVHVPAHVSNSAGTYVCNHVMYGVLHYIAASGSHARAGFVHVPYAEEQVLDRPAVPALSLASMVRGMEAAIAAAIRHGADLKVSEGTLD